MLVPLRRADSLTPVTCPTTSSSLMVSVWDGPVSTDGSLVVASARLTVLLTLGLGQSDVPHFLLLTAVKLVVARVAVVVPAAKVKVECPSV